MTSRGTLVARVARRSVVRRSAAAALGIATVLGTAGCGGPVKRAIFGNVTLEGQPLDEAVIMFIPLDTQAGKTGAAIKAGHYEVTRDVGLLPGRYRVEIADDPPIDHAAMKPSLQVSQARRKLPEVYASVASPLAIDVTAKSPATIDFTLTSSPPGSR